MPLYKKSCYPRFYQEHAIGEIGQNGFKNNYIKNNSFKWGLPSVGPCIPPNHLHFKNTANIVLSWKRWQAVLRQVKFQLQAVWFELNLQLDCTGICKSQFELRL